jgi:hypothetical protein
VISDWGPCGVYDDCVAIHYDQQTWTISQGLPFKKVVYVRDRRTRRRLNPSAAAGAFLIPGTPNVTVPFTVTVQGRGIVLELTDAQTLALAIGGPYNGDVLATIADHQEKVLELSINVIDYTTVTPGDAF